MRITVVIVMTILSGDLFTQELFYGEDGMQRRGYALVDTTLTFSGKFHPHKTAYLFQRIYPFTQYVVSGSDTIPLPQKMLLEKSDSAEYFALYNSGNNPIKLLRQDGSLITVKEAINYQNRWLPVEFWGYSWCGNSYITLTLNPGQLMLFKSYKLKAGRTTLVKLRLKTETNGILVSEPFECSVDPKYFVLHTDLKKYVAGSTGRFSYLK